MKRQIKVTATFDHTINLLAILAAILIAFIMLGTSIEVFTRYVLGGSIVWMFEVVEYSLLFITFLGAVWVLRSEGHVTMDIVLTRLNPRTRAMLNIITSILGAIACLVVAWYGTVVTWSHFQRGTYLGTILEPPDFAILIVIPVGLFLLFIQFLRRTYGFVGNYREHRG